jgi:hypothetical protein
MPDTPPSPPMAWNVFFTFKGPGGLVDRVPNSYNPVDSPSLKHLLQQLAESLPSWPSMDLTVVGVHVEPVGQAFEVSAAGQGAPSVAGVMEVSQPTPEEAQQIKEEMEKIINDQPKVLTNETSTPGASAEAARARKKRTMYDPPLAKD